MTGDIQPPAVVEEGISTTTVRGVAGVPSPDRVALPRTPAHSRGLIAVSVRLPVDLLDTLDRWAETAGKSRSEALRIAIDKLAAEAMDVERMARLRAAEAHVEAAMRVLIDY